MPSEHSKSGHSGHSDQMDWSSESKASVSMESVGKNSNEKSGKSGKSGQSGKSVKSASSDTASKSSSKPEAKADSPVPKITAHSNLHDTIKYCLIPHYMNMVNNGATLKNKHSIVTKMHPDKVKLALPHYTSRFATVVTIMNAVYVKASIKQKIDAQALHDIIHESLRENRLDIRIRVD